MRVGGETAGDTVCMFFVFVTIFLWYGECSGERDLAGVMDCAHVFVPYVEEDNLFKVCVLEVFLREQGVGRILAQRVGAWVLCRT